jgi:hypothetical protein
MQLLVIAKNSFLESIRQPVFAVLILGGILAMTFNVNLAAFTLEDDNKLLIDLCLSTLFIVGLLLAAFTATSVLSKEIESKTVLTVVSKPVPRPTLVVGKFLGVTAALGLAFYVLSIVFLLAVRHRVQASVRAEDVFDMPVLTFSLLCGGGAVIVAGLANYLYRRPFPSTLSVALAVGLTIAYGLVLCIAREWYFQHPLTDVDPQLLIALAMVFEALAIISAVAIAASTRLGQLSTLVVCIAIFLCGLLNEFFLGASLRDGASWGMRLLAPLYVAIPNLQFLWPADALTQGIPLTTAYFAGVTAYAACLTAALVSLAVLLFQGRDVG